MTIFIKFTAKSSKTEDKPKISKRSQPLLTNNALTIALASVLAFFVDAFEHDEEATHPEPAGEAEELALADKPWSAAAVSIFMASFLSAGDIIHEKATTAAMLA